MSILLPLPDKRGIAEMKELIVRKTGLDVSDEEAADVLVRLMRYMYILRRLDRRVGEAKQKECRLGREAS